MIRQRNPYLAGNPVRSDENFFGRQDILRWVEDELQNFNTDSLVVFGQRRIGKTSLLLKLERSLPRGLYFPVYFDLLDRARASLGNVLEDLAAVIMRKLHLKSPGSTTFDNKGRYFVDEFLPKVLLHLGERARLVVLFDEFEIVDQVHGGSLQADSAANALQPFLRTIMGTEPRLAFIFVVGRGTEDLSQNVRTTFKGALQYPIWTLDRSSAVELVRQAESNGTLRFTDDGIDKILSLASGHPFLTQLLCQRVWQRAYGGRACDSSNSEQGRGEGSMSRLIGSVQVEIAAEDALTMGDGALSWIWGGLSPAERIYAAALGEMASEEKSVSSDYVLNRIIEYFPNRGTREIERAPAFLVKRRMIAEDGVKTGRFHFEIQLFGRWVNLKRSLPQVEEELDRLKPEAEIPFASGKYLFLNKQWEEAQHQFKKTLLINPDHTGARVMLGEIYLSKSLIDQAIREFRCADALNSEEARLPLVRALVTKAEKVIGVSEAEALDACEQVLKLVPTQPAAQRIRSGIFVNRGDEAFKRRNFAEALECYGRGGDAVKRYRAESHLRRQQKVIEEAIEKAALVPKAAAEASFACHQAARVAGREIQPILLASVIMLKRFEGMTMRVAEGIAALRDSRLGLANEKFGQVSLIRPSDERLGRKGMSKVARERPARELAGSGPLDARELIRQAAQGLRGGRVELGEAQSSVSVLVRSLEQAISAVEVPAATVHGDAARSIWDGALKHLHEKQGAARSYLGGLQALQQNRPERALMIFGWAKGDKLEESSFATR